MDMMLEIVEGMQFDRGYLSPYFVTDPERQGVCAQICQHSLILPPRKESLDEMNRSSSPPRAGCESKDKPLLIIAEDVEGEALATLVVNKLRGTYKCVGREGALALATAAKPLPRDIAILTGGKAISEDLGMTWRT